MKKFTELLIFTITIFGIPGIVQLAFPEYFNNHNNLVWGITVIIATLLSLTQFNFNTNPTLRRYSRTIRYYLFKPQAILIILLLQLVCVLCILIFSPNAINVKAAFISLGLNLAGINLLVILGKIPNTDSKELLFHNPENGHIFLYSNNKLRFIPDPATFNLLGLSWGDTIDVNKEELDTYTQDAPITSVTQMRILQYKHNIYGLVNEKLKHIPDIKTLNYILELRTSKNIEQINNTTGYKIDKKPFVTVIW